MKKIISEVVRELKRGGVVIMPAGTVYGLFCRAGDKQAVKTIYHIKGRSYDSPLQVFLPAVKSVKKYSLASPGRDKLVKEHLPGPCTVVMKLRPSVKKRFPFLKKGTIGIRVVKSRLLGPIIRAAGPLAATSANFSGGKTPVVFNDIPFDLRKKAGLSVICDPMVTGRASKVIDITSGKSVILRG